MDGSQTPLWRLCYVKITI